MENKTEKTANHLNERPGFHVWWRLLRPHTLTASFIPVFVGTMLAILDNSFRPLLFIAMLIAAMIIQAATNMFNEYYDYVRGLDNENSVGIGGTIVRDGVKPNVIKKLAFILYGIAALLGIYICFASNWWIAVIGLVCMLIGYLYTGGPIPIAYTPFGELFSGFLMGTVIIAISYYIQTLTITWQVLVISIPIAIFIGCILLANNIRDLDGDKENGRKTIAILLGHNKAIILLSSLMLTSYALTAAFIIGGLLPIYSIISLLSIPKAREAVRTFQENTTNVGMIPAMIATAKTNTFYGGLIGISLLLQILFPLTL
ncbi:1,4-dihydroxy-2-naphthoate octaprenyltransferase [Gracilibacillus boraciitolerans JCM 21714]|uniref:1,4-dihydroxy-2-naphthoate octaprenyltransferase n=1 Tax=Gracilibacillus boraciitolerans JCM 21714 TaxID=1298598 RepID=W4VKW3_9BACI|nr:1,4-dihydroxy-2-naphthoate polyprenyltransferase [Gracilibacillus boraciitolerans]GAE94020.1 1,4-dihydroxy-2-naphthoate octaprenyltransferase [Gracilibacillus boraciitolerans JCM 21714]